MTVLSGVTLCFWMNCMVSVTYITLFSPFTSLPIFLDAERSQTSLVIGYAMMWMYSIMLPVIGFRIALMYLLVAVSDKGYILLWSGIYIVLTRSLTMIAWTSSALNRVGYMCVLNCCFQRYVLIGDLISSCTSSTLVASNLLRYFTLGGVSLTLGSSLVLGLSDVGSAVVFVVSSENITDSSLRTVKVLSFNDSKVMLYVDSLMPRIIPMPSLLLYQMMIMLASCIVWG